MPVSPQILIFDISFGHHCSQCYQTDLHFKIKVFLFATFFNVVVRQQGNQIQLQKQVASQTM